MAKKRKKRKTAAKSGFKISYEASILTLITFAISITSLGWQTVNYFAGAKVRLIPPDQITIGSSPTVTYPPRDGGPFVHFIARMGYVNEASAGYNATVRAERVRVRAAGQRAFESRWYFFVISDAVGAKNDELQVKKEKSAQPFPLAECFWSSHVETGCRMCRYRVWASSHGWARLL